MGQMSSLTLPADDRASGGDHSPGGEDRATLGSDPSAPPGPAGEWSCPRAPSIPGGDQSGKPLGGLGGGFPPASLDLYQTSSSATPRQALTKAGFPALGERKNRCGRDKVWFECPNCGEEVWVWYRCGLRVCPECGSKRGRRLYAKYGHLRRISGLKHLVLTMPNLQHLTREDVQGLGKRFAELRNTPPLGESRKYQKRRREARGSPEEVRRGGLWPGGLWAIEITYSKARGWNLHLHAIIEGVYYSQERITELWEAIEGGQRVVWIRAVRGPGQALKYVLKPGGEIWQHPEALKELVEATRGLRLVSLWGLWLGEGMEVLGEPNVCGECGEPLRYVITLPHVGVYPVGVRAPPC